ncbi:MAG: hypothetical protein RR614_11795, partial [Eubacterium sp.]
MSGVAIDWSKALTGLLVSLFTMLSWVLTALLSSPSLSRLGCSSALTATALFKTSGAISLMIQPSVLRVTFGSAGATVSILAVTFTDAGFDTAP